MPDKLTIADKFGESAVGEDNKTVHVDNIGNHRNWTILRKIHRDWRRRIYGKIK